MKNKFIVVEGIEGSGKTTAINNIKKMLKDHGVKDIICTREPGSTPMCEKLRNILKKDEEVFTEKAETLIFYAARIQLIDTVIKPALANGFWVIGDRHDLSSQAYQGRNKLNFEINSLIKFLKKFLLEGFRPDLTFYIDITPSISIKRTMNRGKKLDRFEKKNINFFTQVRQRYLELASINKKIKIIDGTKSIKEVNKIINNFLKKWLTETK